MKNTSRLLSLLAICVLPLTAGAQTFQENFENFPGLFTGTNPWVLQNRSDSPTGGVTWFQGDPFIFTAQSGTGYAAANFLSTGGQTGTEHISNWFLSPTLNLTLGSTLTFYTRSAGALPDRLEVRLSLNGSSTNVGTTSSDVGDFTVVLQTINPAQLAAGNATAYPTTWTQFTVNVVGVPVAGTTGRIGFRYDVTNSGNGATAVNGDYIGVDNVTSTGLTVVPEPSTYFLCLSGLAVGGWLLLRRRRMEPLSA